MKVECKVSKEVGTPREFLVFKTKDVLVRLPVDLSPLSKQLEELKEKHEPWQFFLEAELLRKSKCLIPGIGQVKKSGWELGDFAFNDSIAAIRDAVLEKIAFDPEPRQQQLSELKEKSKKGGDKK